MAGDRHSPIDATFLAVARRTFTSIESTSEQAEAYVRSLPPNVPMARIAVRPDVVVVLDFETRFPSALSSLGLAP